MLSIFCLKVHYIEALSLIVLNGSAILKVFKDVCVGPGLSIIHYRERP